MATELKPEELLNLSEFIYHLRYSVVKSSETQNAIDLMKEAELADDLNLDMFDGGIAEGYKLCSVEMRKLAIGAIEWYLAEEKRVKKAAKSKVLE